MGTCLHLEAAPGFWPWTQAVEGLLRWVGDATADVLGGDAGWVPAIVPAAGDAPSETAPSR